MRGCGPLEHIHTSLINAAAFFWSNKLWRVVPNTAGTHTEHTEVPEEEEEALQTLPLKDRSPRTLHRNLLLAVEPTRRTVKSVH